MMNHETETRVETRNPETNVRRKRVESLVREEFSRKSFSYFLTAIFAVFCGFVILPGFSTAIIPLEESARGGGWLVDFIFLSIVSILSINVLSKNYFLIHRDPFSGWLVFLRSLPVSAREMVVARSLIMLPATAVMTAIFFAPITLASVFLAPRFDVAQYLWFATIWLGYALAAGGMNLLVELGVRGKLALAFQWVWFAAIIAVVWLLGGNIVLTTFELAGEYGPLTAGVSFLAGGILFALFAKATERRVADREFVI